MKAPYDFRKGNRGGFADGVIAHEVAWLGGETFVSFDTKAVEAIVQQRMQTKLLV